MLSRYIGAGHGGDDYWDCYCIRSGGAPPTHLNAFVKMLDNGDQVLAWFKQHKFNYIECTCACCHGAQPQVRFGWRRTDEVEEEEEEVEDDPPDADLFAQWTPAQDKHAFRVDATGRLEYVGAKIYETPRQRLQRVCHEFAGVVDDDATRRPIGSVRTKDIIERDDDDLAEFIKDKIADV